MFSYRVLFYTLELMCNQLSWHYDKTAISPSALAFPYFWFILLSPSFYFNIIEEGGQIGTSHLPQSNDPSTICVWFDCYSKTSDFGDQAEKWSIQDQIGFAVQKEAVITLLFKWGMRFDCGNFNYPKVMEKFCNLPPSLF